MWVSAALTDIILIPRLPVCLSAASAFTFSAFGPYGQANVLLHTVSVFKSHISDARLLRWLRLLPAVAFNISLLVINLQLRGCVSKVTLLCCLFQASPHY